MKRVLASLELRLLARDPAFLAFGVVVPMALVLVVTQLVGDTADPDRYRGVGAADFYGTAGVVVAVCAASLIVASHRVATHRATGMLRRYEGSGVAGRTVLTVHVAATALLAGIMGFAAGVIMSPLRNGGLPEATAAAVVASIATAAVFALFGVALGALSATPRQARMVGAGVWLVLIAVGVTALPAEAWNGAVGRLQRLTPTWHALRATHDVWLGLDAGASWLVLFAVFGLAVGSAAMAFRLE